MPAFLILLRRFLVAFSENVLAYFTLNNLTGWIISGGIAASFIAIWISVLNHVYQYLLDELTSPIGIFQALPLSGVWILKQAFPLKYGFDCAVTVLVVRVFAAKLMIIAIFATRYLKGK